MNNLIHKLLKYLEKIRLQFEGLEDWEWNKPIRCTQFYIQPQKKLHDSGYKMIKVIGILNNGKKVLRTCHSDVLHFKIHPDIKTYCGINTKYPLILYNFDVDKKGNMRFFTWDNMEFKLGADLSSMDITIVNKETEND